MFAVDEGLHALDDGFMGQRFLLEVFGVFRGDEGTGCFALPVDFGVTASPMSDSAAKGCTYDVCEKFMRGDELDVDDFLCHDFVSFAEV